MRKCIWGDGPSERLGKGVGFRRKEEKKRKERKEMKITLSGVITGASRPRGSPRRWCLAQRVGEEGGHYNKGWGQGVGVST